MTREHEERPGVGATAVAEVRAVERVVRAQPTSDGAGVRLNRSLGTAQLPDLDPFLMLDEFKSDDARDYLAGFPDHPHRGFETVTYMLAGAMRHQDSAGNSGDLAAGGAQWMTAARGVVHSEMPRQEDGLLWGFQLWINLPARDKMGAPRYQDFAPAQIPERALPGGGLVRVVAGDSAGVAGAVRGINTAPLMLDVRLEPGATFAHAVPRGHQAFAYVYDGQGVFGGADGPTVAAGHLAVLADGAEARVATDTSPARFLLLAARPLHEPISRYGPFVMNTRQEIEQAFRDYHAGTLAG